MTDTESKKTTQTQMSTSLDGNECMHHDLDAIKLEIKRYQENYAQSFLEIGRLLLIAKENFGKYGDWLKWLNENVDLSTVKVQRLMRVAKKFGNKTPVPYLDFSKMYILTAIPENELESFLNTAHYINGQRKFVNSMTKRELESVVHNHLKKKKSSSEKREKKISNKASGYKIFKQLEQIKISISAFVDLIQEPDNDLVNRNILVAELQELCNNTIQKLSN